jgi:endo-1,4-beta-xylanase
MNSILILAVVTALLTLTISPIGHASDKADPKVEGLMKLDRDGDGALSEDEAPPGMFSLLDTNQDGLAERAEVVALMQRAGRPFSWVNTPSASQSHPQLSHATFNSPSMQIPVGYNINLPPGYAEASNDNRRYPVIYYLHGGRPGNESLSIGLVKYIDAAIQSGSVQPLIFVWVNGGKVSHYNYGDSKGEDTFVKELIPHIDRTYRTIANRGGRALQGFSQGGRGATRIMFKYPELFISAAPGGPGYAVEKQISENNGVEKDTRQGAAAQSLDFGKGNDAFSLAREYAKHPPQVPLSIMIWVGTKGFNYDATLEYLGFLYGLGVSVERIIAPGVDHNPMAFYEARGEALLQFHDQHWRAID